MAGGLLYNSTSFSQAYALDAATGKLLWVFDPKSYQAGTPPNFGFINRGLGALVEHDREKDIPRHRRQPADGPERGRRPGRLQNWANGGEFNLLEGLGLEVSNELYGVSSPPLVCGEAVIVGSSILEFPPRPDTPPGDVRAFNARTGELMWHFHSIPKDGQYGADTWEDGSNNRNAAANVWTYMSCDEEAGLAYLPFGTPVNDFWGGNRPGDNLFGESLVAVDMNTGERRWHFQTTRHGLWDYDLPAAPVLLDMPDGRKLAAQVTKQAFLFVFDRLTGEPVWPIKNVPVSASEVPGERAAATQPVPTRPAPFDRQGFTREDLNDLAPELLNEAMAIFNSMDGGASVLASHGSWPADAPGSRCLLVRRRLRAQPPLPVRTVHHAGYGCQGRSHRSESEILDRNRSHTRAVSIQRHAHGQTPVRPHYRHRYGNRRTRLDDARRPRL